MDKQYIIIGGELYHYGVPGMKWGHKKSIVSTQKPRKIPGVVVTDESLPKGRKLPGVVVKDEKPKIIKPKILEKKQKTKKTAGKDLVDTLIFGPLGKYRINKLQEKGHTEKQARAKVAVGQILMGAAGIALNIGGYAIAKKHMGL